MNALLHATNLNVIKNQIKIIDSVSLSIIPKDFITIIGPNGAGKTTLIKTLMGLERVSSGSIEKNPLCSFAYMPQDQKINPSIPMRVADYLVLGNSHPDTTLHKELLSSCDLHHLQHIQISQISSGELKRVQLCRVLLKKPGLLFLDEPTQYLDLPSQAALYKIIQTYYETYPIAIVMVSHDLHWVMAESKQVLCFYHHICCSGTPETVAQDKEFIEIFGSEFAGTMARYRHHHDHTHA
ncbi:MAG: metal ABC transporter ATP-binding protein [Methylacidiphilales bacterium]|nr:metal ABC transporter ATP-binding protein [Candidatus Methylacidiphilales bacterium]